MIPVIYVGIGGFFGAICRFFIARLAPSYLGTFPYGTLFVNVTGTFILAFINYLVLEGRAIPADYRNLITVGFIGAYTTMSTFSFESMRFLDQGEYMHFALNIFLNLGLCLVAVALGKYCALLLTK